MYVWNVRLERPSASVEYLTAPCLSSLEAVVLLRDDGDRSQRVVSVRRRLPSLVVVVVVVVTQLTPHIIIIIVVVVDLIWLLDALQRPQQRLIVAQSDVHVLSAPDQTIRYVKSILNRLIGSRPSDHYFCSVCLFVCVFVCLFVQSFSQPSSIRFGSN